MTLPEQSRFHPLDPTRIVYEDPESIAFYDAFPISPGHTLVVSKEVTVSIFDLDDFHLASLWQAVDKVRDLLQQKYNPDGFNIGVNDGPAAGQTIPHGHIHVIPRYKGDIPDPRGGVRWVFPEKARYW